MWQLLWRTKLTMACLFDYYDDEKTSNKKTEPPTEESTEDPEKLTDSNESANCGIQVPRISKRSIKTTQRYNTFAFKRRMKLKKPRNVKNRMGSYLARRIARNASSVGPQYGRDWTVKEKSALLKALQTINDPDNYDSLASHVITRSPEEVKDFIEARENYMMRNKKYFLDLFNMKEPAQPSPSSQWAKLCSYNANPIMNKALHEVLKSSFEPLSVGEMRMDFSLIYNYLANLVGDKELPDLSPLEACLLWDTISDVYTNTDILKNPECLNHLKQQKNKINSCCIPLNTNRARNESNLTETLQRDWMKAYNSACEEGIFKNEVLDSCQANNLSQEDAASNPLNSEGTRSNYTSQNQEDRKRFQAVLELIGVSPQFSSPQISDNRAMSNNGTTLKVSNSVPSNEDLESLCYCAMNPLSLPAKFLSHRKLMQSCVDLKPEGCEPFGN